MTHQLSSTFTQLSQWGYILTWLFSHHCYVDDTHLMLSMLPQILTLLRANLRMSSRHLIMDGKAKFQLKLNPTKTELYLKTFDLIICHCIWQDCPETSLGCFWTVLPWSFQFLFHNFRRPWWCLFSNLATTVTAPGPGLKSNPECSYKTFNLSKVSHTTLQLHSLTNIRFETFILAYKRKKTDQLPSYSSDHSPQCTTLPPVI